ncbi:MULTISPECIES: carboxymuconolactone decarboxylase family protein [unclassified Streptomyces]|uniref:carboxymuconolactone decarboxylase family protein n=1 Tax=unclassified Streptomyces TaxID=2593676 RepID=UPI0022B6FE16|nr:MULTISPECIES: carboxymuconolactone decarboxylase family protein [unclassified Streptomyces]MCZ7416814.1 carboxymuconolactone decarboxylase family protein [Streptomyces sp. WMMC897]MCZ7433376.1 carboxymuconolactone decarboxylase family protein [Streptomyces sp. WMMC1477]
MATGKNERLNLRELSSSTYAVMNRLAGQADTAAEEAGLESELLHLVRIRASQINGCAFCIDMHTIDARRADLAEQRIFALNAWRETPFYSDRERAALEVTEAVTLIHDGQLPDEVFELGREAFGEEQLAQLVWVIVAINSYNRLAITARLAPGNYNPGA